MGNSVVQAHVPDEVRRAAGAVINSAGLSVSDVMRVVLTRIAEEKELPLDFFQPNAATKEAMQDAAAGRLTRTTLDGLRGMMRDCQTHARD